MSNIWFTSDTHFGHKIEYCQRPFSSTLEMDKTIINNWNNVVNDDDEVYHLGDFTLGGLKQAQYYFSQLKGQIKILSNPWHHDKRWLAERSKSGVYLSSASHHEIQLLPPMEVLEVPTFAEGNHSLVVALCHYPLAIWDRKHYGAIHLYGHSHGNYKSPDKALDVGVDGNNFYPWSIKDVFEVLCK